MPGLRAALGLLLVVGLGIAALRSVKYNDTLTFSWHGVGTITLGSGFASVNCYLEYGDHAQGDPTGFSAEFGKVIRGRSSHIDSSNQDVPVGFAGGWTRIFTELPGGYFDDEEITFGIPYGWLLVGASLLYLFCVVREKGRRKPAQDTDPPQRD